MATNQIELIEEVLDKFVELYGSKPADWPQEAREKAEQLMCGCAEAFKVETRKLYERFNKL